jgi:hypothetical protein
MIAAVRWRRWLANQSRTPSPSGETLLAEDTTRQPCRPRRV